MQLESTLETLCEIRQTQKNKYYNSFYMGCQEWANP